MQIESINITDEAQNLLIMMFLQEISISYLENWASTRNIIINKNYITEGMNGYNDSKDGIIISQNVEKGTLVSTISSLNVDVIKVEKKEDVIIDEEIESTDDEILDDIINVDIENNTDKKNDAKDDDEKNKNDKTTDEENNNTNDSYNSIGQENNLNDNEETSD